MGYRPARHARAGSPGIAAVLDVLDVLDREGPTSLAQLARETGTAKSTLHRVCTMMSERGWIARDPHTGYLELGPRVAWLAHGTPLSPLTAGFHGVARRLVARHNETTCLTVLEGSESVFIAKEETTHAVRLVTAVGTRLPAFASASGRAMLADRPEDEVAAMYDGCTLETPTGRRLDGLGELVQILREVRDRGYAENIDETALGLHCIAVPVGPPGRVVAALTLCVPTGRMSAVRKREMLPDLARAAREIMPLGDAPGPSENGSYTSTESSPSTRSNNFAGVPAASVVGVVGAPAAGVVGVVGAPASAGAGATGDPLPGWAGGRVSGTSNRKVAQ
jgi:DNA-binding IclR family transcriptional regulator